MALNLFEVVSEALEDGVALAFGDFALDLIEGEVDDIVVMDFGAGELIAQFEPYVVKQIDFLRRQPWRMRTQVKNLFLAGGREDFERNARPRLRHALPRQADFASLLGDRHLRRASGHDGAGLQICGGAQNAFPQSLAAATARRTGLPSFSAMASTLVNRSCSMVLKSWSGARSYSPDAARRSRRTCSTTMSASRLSTRRRTDFEMIERVIRADRNEDVARANSHVCRRQFGFLARLNWSSSTCAAPACL